MGEDLVKWRVEGLCYSKVSSLLTFFTKDLTLSSRRSLLYRSQSIDLLCKSIDWFLYDKDLRHEWVQEVVVVLSIFCGTTILQNICHVFPGLNWKKKIKNKNKSRNCWRYNVHNLQGSRLSLVLLKYYDLNVKFINSFLRFKI